MFNIHLKTHQQRELRRQCWESSSSNICSWYDLHAYYSNFNLAISTYTSLLCSKSVKTAPQGLVDRNIWLIISRSCVSAQIEPFQNYLQVVRSIQESTTNITANVHSSDPWMRQDSHSLSILSIRSSRSSDTSLIESLLYSEVWTDAEQSELVSYATEDQKPVWPGKWQWFIWYMMKLGKPHLLLSVSPSKVPQKGSPEEWAICILFQR